MSVQLKTVLIVLGAGMALLLAFYVGSQPLILEPFAALEREQMRDNLLRVEQAFESEIHGMETMVRDWAEWDDTYHYMDDPSDVYETSNIMASTFETLRISHIIYLDTSGELYRAFTDAPDQPGKDALTAHLEATFESPGEQGKPLARPFSGLYATPEQIWMLSGAPILTSDLQGPAKGTLLMLRPFTQETARLLAERTRLETTFMGPEEARSGDLRPAWQASAEGSMVVAPVSESRIAGFMMMDDIFGQPALMARVERERDIYRQGQDTVQRNLAFWLIAALVITLVVLGLLRRVILSRLMTLSRSARFVGAAGVTSSRLPVHSKDEIGQVKQAINEMLDGLEWAYQQRQATEKRQQRQNELLIGLSRDVAECQDIDQAASCVNAAAIEGLSADRSSVWLFQNGRKALRCLDVLEIHRRHYQANVLLLRDDHIEAFEQLEALSLEPVSALSICRVLREGLAHPQDVESDSHQLLPVWHDGAIAGVVLVEYGQSTGEWTLDQRLFAVSIGEFIGQAISNEERRTMEAELRRLASYDALTELPNRTLFHERLHQAIARAQIQKDHSVGLLFIDLDGFKPINDALGHEAGDRLLVELARRFQEAIRTEDTIARIGGDEFTVILTPLRKREDAERVAEKLLSAVDDPVDVGKEQVSVGCSIGVAVFPDDAAGYLELINHADTAMYRAKDQGGSAYVVYGEMREKMQRVGEDAN